MNVMQRSMSPPHLGDGIDIEIVLERYFFHDHISQHTADPSHGVVHLTAMRMSILGIYSTYQTPIHEWMFLPLLTVFENSLCNASKSAHPSPH